LSSAEGKNLPDLTRRARNYLNPADLPVTRLINPIVYVALTLESLAIETKMMVSRCMVMQRQTGK
jgi:hypothetical protein